LQAALLRAGSRKERRTKQNGRKRFHFDINLAWYPLPVM
jgi:hypothetical protein